MLRSVVPFRRWHFDWLGESIEPCLGLSAATLGVLEAQESYTGMVDGEVVACAGLVRQWPTRHIAWALLNREKAPAHILWISRAVRAHLAGVKGRIEMTVRADFPQGQRWAELLGFKIETPRLEKFGPEGEDHIGYVRIN